ncbi:transmembrane protease serine 13-like [Brachionichthys hirsutus]|uniref:transmembrane protease serine 13-like n=1 Tax=Brachionichthys hirsutus TaxID=412623 RepID=UPI0036049EEA
MRVYLCTVCPASGSQKKRCCRTNARCYGGSGAGLLLFALLMLAIWLGIRFGTRLVPFKMAIVRHNDDDGEHTDKVIPPVKNNNCPSNAIDCDGVADCSDYTDETNCVRFIENGRLEVKTARDHRFLPVCYEGWNQSYADQTCAQLGFRESTLTKIKITGDFVGLALTYNSSQFIQGVLDASTSCPNNEVVSLKCVECGKRQSTSKIVGGQIATPQKWPWQMSLQLNGKHTCGGVLIAHDIVLTAAHCVLSPNDDETEWAVYGGMASLTSPPNPYQIKKIIINENYNKTTHDSDIAIIILQCPVTFNDKLWPVCLPPTGKEFEGGALCSTTGFGATGHDDYSNDLRQVQVNIVEHKICNSNEMYNGTVTDNMICAGIEGGGYDSCYGDSGGPFVCEAEVWYLAGLTSWGIGCAEAKWPGVYSRVSRLLPWIYQNLQKWAVNGFVSC